MNIKEVIRPLPDGQTQSVHLGSYARFLQQEADDVSEVGGRVSLNPWFQRGHVWTVAQQVAFMEGLLRGTAVAAIRFNSPCRFVRDNVVGDLGRYDTLCVDGLQRSTAILLFLAGEVKPFGLSVDDIRASDDVALTDYRVQITFHGFTTKKDLLQFYVDLNSGGTVHSKEEINRIRREIDSLTP